MTAFVHQLNVSDGGVPKSAVDSAYVNVRGIVGDTQADRKHHGRPSQALCLYSTEVIDALRAEGHPIAAGNAGENVTISGLDWSELSSGVRLRLGARVLVELTDPATPCGKNARWFSDRDPSRIDHDRHRGWSRWYAKVLAGGDVACGDAVEVVSR